MSYLLAEPEPISILEVVLFDVKLENLELVCSRLDVKLIDVDLFSSVELDFDADAWLFSTSFALVTACASVSVNAIAGPALSSASVREFNLASILADSAARDPTEIKLLFSEKWNLTSFGIPWTLSSPP